MKKSILLTLLAIGGAFSSFAQISYGVKAGFNSSSMTFDGEDNSFDGGNDYLKRLAAWNAGVIVDIQLADNFYLQPQLLVSAKGIRFKGEETYEVGGISYTEKIDGKLTTTYLELPVNLLYKHELGPGKIFGGFGPYVAYGLGGKLDGFTEEGFDDPKVKFDGDDEATDNNIHYKGIDAGANFTIGYELNNGLLLGVNYSLGLTNIDVYDKSTTKNNYFGISVGYLLKKKK